jgi:hypothetical protein
LIGNFYRNGKLYTQEQVQVNDHDFRSAADGMVVPHGLYDLTRNIGYLTLGTSHDTSEFACACLQLWWLTDGRVDYPAATEILLLCDGGGSNNARYYIFKQDLQRLAEQLGIAIRIAHYPPYTSKYNPRPMGTRHRLFPHVTRACQGVVFNTLETVQAFMAKTSTKTGLRVFTAILDKVFETKRKVEANFKQTMTLGFDSLLPQWNYVAIPKPLQVLGLI